MVVEHPRARMLISSCVYNHALNVPTLTMIMPITVTRTHGPITHAFVHTPKQGLRTRFDGTVKYGHDLPIK